MHYVSKCLEKHQTTSQRRIEQTTSQGASSKTIYILGLTDQPESYATRSAMHHAKTLEP